jgi:general secretion pathway protein F
VNEVPTFSYVVIDSRGRRRAGLADSSTESALTSLLEESGEFVVTVRVSDAEQRASPGGRAPSPKRLLDVTRSLAALIPAGLPLAEAIQIAGQMADPSTRAVLENVRERVEQGEALAGAMAASGSFFPAHYVSMIAAGEKSGTLATSVTKLAAQLEHEDRLRSQLVAAAIYPILLSTASACSVLLLVGFVLPRFAVLLGTTGARLPALAALSLQVAHVTRNALPFAATGAVAAVAIVVVSGRTDAGEQWQSSLLHRVPVVGTLRRERIGSRFARLTGMLLGGGVPLSQAMDAAVEAIDDPVAQSALYEVRSEVLSGATLSGALAARRFFPDLLTRFVLLGEKSGRLPEFLVQAAQYYEELLQEKARKLIAIAEPTVILLFGCVVGVIALALLQTVYGVNASALR